jgi:hypothetical protein
MARKKDTFTGSLFGIIEEQEEKEARASIPASPTECNLKYGRGTNWCPQRKEVKTDTDWGLRYGIRMTWTCITCGEVRGRI